MTRSTQEGSERSPEGVVGDQSFRCGLVAILGEPNVGKSTLMNRMVGFKVAAVTAKPQTTRDRILGVVTRPAGQIVFVDTPGVHKAKKALNEHLVRQALSAIEDVDLALLMVLPEDRPSRTTFGLSLLCDKLEERPLKKILVINKIDTLKDRRQLLPQMAEWNEAYRFEALVPVCSLTGEGLAELETEILRALPEGPPLYPEDTITDRPERWLAAETIREVITEMLREELPYSVAVQVEEFRERGEAEALVQATVYVERSSQKPIVLGRGGARIKEIGIRSRKRLQAILGRRIHLKLWVKVEPNWTRDPRGLKKMGYV